jgi:hypothetical protein
MNAHDHVAFAHSGNSDDLRIEYLRDPLHFEVVVPGAERPHLPILGKDKVRG